MEDWICLGSHCYFHHCCAPIRTVVAVGVEASVVAVVLVILVVALVSLRLVLWVVALLELTMLGLLQLMALGLAAMDPAAATMVEPAAPMPVGSEPVLWLVISETTAAIAAVQQGCWKQQHLQKIHLLIDIVAIVIQQ